MKWLVEMDTSQCENNLFPITWGAIFRIVSKCDCFAYNPIFHSPCRMAQKNPKGK